MVKYGLWLWLVALGILNEGCTQPIADVEPASGLRVIPIGVNNWWLSWNPGQSVVIDGTSGQVQTPLTIDGTSVQRITIDGRKLELPRRISNECESIRFAVLGDGRAHIDGVGPTAYWTAMLREVAQHQPKFILNTGDLVKNGSRTAEWDNYLRLTPAWPPMVPVRGNHDRGGLFEKHHLNPGPVFWFRAGPIAVIGFDTEVPDEQRATLIAKLDETLKSVSAPWRLVFLHRPIYSQGRHGSDERGWNVDLVPIFERHQVDLVIAGHDHNYERFCKMRGLGDQRRCTDGAGTVYIVSGGAATFTTPFPGLARKGDSRSKDRDAELSRSFSNAHHFLLLDASPDTLKVTAHRTMAGNLRPPGLFDSLRLSRPHSGCAQ